MLNRIIKISEFNPTMYALYTKMKKLIIDVHLFSPKTNIKATTHKNENSRDNNIENQPVSCFKNDTKAVSVICSTVRACENFIAVKMPVTIPKIMNITHIKYDFLCAEKWSCKANFKFGKLKRILVFIQ